MSTLSRRTLLASLAAGLGTTLLGQSPTKAAPATRRIRYIDGLCIPSYMGGWEDLPASGLDALILDVSDGEMVKLPDGTEAFRRTLKPCLKGLEEGIKALEKVPGAFVARKGSEIPATGGSGRIAGFLQFQGCDWVEQDLTRLATLHAKGLRVAQFTHHFGNSLAGGCMDLPQTGLTPLGREALGEMERLGLLPDLAHASDATGRDVVKAAKRPVIVSHGACRALVDNARCTSDAVLRGVADRGGVVGLFMMSFWLTNDPVPSVDHVVAQLRHIIRVAGLGAAAIANDYAPGGEPGLRQVNNDNAKGIQNYLPWWQSMRARGVPGFERTPQHVVIPELNTPRRFFTLHAALEKAKFKPSEIEAILGGNWVRVLREALG